jgi:hypothetical protein
MVTGVLAVAACGLWFLFVQPRLPSVTRYWLAIAAIAGFVFNVLMLSWVRT